MTTTADNCKTLPAPLKSFEANVKVFIGKDKDRSEHLCHGLQLASISPWMDEQLSEMMKEEKECYELFLEDISTDTWLDMIKFVLSPASARRMTKEDAVRVVAGYHKYEINLGLEICDLVLNEYLGGLENQILGSTVDQKFMVKALSTANKYNLTQANESASGFITRLFQGKLRSANPSNFSPSDMVEITPILVEIAGKDESFLQQILPFHCRMLSIGDVEDIESDTFPSLFCMEWQIHKTGKYLRETVTPSIGLNGAVFGGESLGLVYFSVVEGSPRYISNMTVPLDEHLYKLAVEEVYGEWQIICEMEGNEDDDFHYLWETSFGGFNCDLPPKMGWKPVHPSASGHPKILYYS